jgi:PIN domain nuclease of toxin-antitoxin system
MQIKHAIGKLPLPDRADRVAGTIAAALGAKFLPVTLDHIGALDGLPGIHRDPFDRMLVAQAKYEGVAIVSPDDRLRAYPVNIIW